MEEWTSEDHTVFHIAFNHGHVQVLKYFFETYPTNDMDTQEIYSLPGSSSLFDLAIESFAPEAVWMVLDKSLFRRKEIVDVWKKLSSHVGSAAFIDGIEQDTNSLAKRKEILDEVINLIMVFGKFTRPPTSPIRDPMNSYDLLSHDLPVFSRAGSRLEQDVPSLRQTQPPTRGEKRTEQLNQRKPKRNASNQYASDILPETSQNMCGGRGRGRGRGRGHGHGRQ